MTDILILAACLLGMGAGLCVIATGLFEWLERDDRASGR